MCLTREGTSLTIDPKESARAPPPTEPGELKAEHAEVRRQGAPGVRAAVDEQKVVVLRAATKPRKHLFGALV